MASIRYLSIRTEVQKEHKYSIRYRERENGVSDNAAINPKSKGDKRFMCLKKPERKRMVQDDAGRDNTDPSPCLAQMTILSTLHILKHVIFNKSHNNCYCFHFTDKETEKETAAMICQRHTARY